MKILMRIYKKSFCVMLCLIFIVSLFSMAGCGGNKDEITELKVYYVKNNYYQTVLGMYDQLAQQINLNCVVFETDEEMASQLTADMAAGNGPDIMLFTQSSRVDVNKAMKGGSFADLTNQLQADEKYNDELFFTNIFESLKVDGKQYIIPFYFQMNMYAFRNEILETNTEDVTGYEKYSQFITTLETQTNMIKEQDDTRKPIVPVTAFPLDNIEAYYQSLGLLSGQNLQNISQNDMEKVMKLVKQMYQLYGVQKENLNGSGEALENMNSYLYQGNIYGMFTGLKALASQREQTLSTCAVPSADGSGYGVQLTAYGTVNAASKHVGESYKVLNYLMNYKDAQYDTILMSVRRESFKEMVEKMTFGYLSYSFSTTQNQFTEAWTEDEKENFSRIINQIEYAYVLNTAVQDIIKEAFQGYLNDRESFEEGWQNMQKQLAIYEHE